jgi:hypothetical protein
MYEKGNFVSGLLVFVKWTLYDLAPHVALNVTILLQSLEVSVWGTFL